jgi:hypothetical protein
MFLKTSRYANTPQIQMALPDGTQINAVQLRTIPSTPGNLAPVTSNDRLDVIAYRMYSDATRYWHVADANSALDANGLLVQWLADDENAQQLSIVVPET